MIYSIMFIATGSCTIDMHQRRRINHHHDEGLAVGGLAIITGMVLVVDLLFLIKELMHK